MKKIALFAALTMMVVSLTACATNGGGKTMKVKCPACGYEFETPLE